MLNSSSVTTLKNEIIFELFPLIQNYVLHYFLLQFKTIHIYTLFFK